MIKCTEKELNTPLKDIQVWYKQNLANTIVIHPQLGEIKIFNASFNETRNKIPDKYLCILIHLKKLLETSTTNAQLVLPNKQRKDGAIGFYYLYNKIKLPTELLAIRMDVLVAKDYKKYYLLQFTKNESYNLDSCMSIDGLSERSIITSTYSITEDEEKVKSPDPENPKVGDVFWLGDNMRIEVIAIENEFSKLNTQLEQFLESIVKYNITILDANGDIIDELGEDTYKNALKVFSKQEHAILSKWKSGAYKEIKRK